MSLSGALRTIRERDPAARSNLEILLTYPGLHALAIYRVAAWFHRRRRRLLARLASHLGRFLTGIEIHPGATIGERVFIDHGMGVVIGETAIVGNDVTLYQGVTLGGTGKERGKRHPTIGDGVTIGVGAKILGAVNVGEGAKIGGGAVVLRDVSPRSTAVGVPARTVRLPEPSLPEAGRLERLPDPERDTLIALVRRIEELEQKVHELEASHASPDAHRTLV